jgi:uridine monophosphate synthetase
VGLDPHPQDLPEHSAGAARDFCLRLIEATSDQAAAYKPNAAFFEAFGAQGLQVLSEIIAAIPQGIPVILDAKRGDIASTAQAYARAAFEILKADAITINPYLGYDAVEPFIADGEKGVFLLCKTSNPGAADLQDATLCSPGKPGKAIRPGLRLYEQVALLAQDWNRADNLGLVVGATQPQALRRVRALASDMWILAPGVGAQGGDIAVALESGLRADGLGMLVPVSRGISRAADPGQSARQWVEQINHRRAAVLARGMASTSASQIAQRGLSELADGLLQAGCVRFGEFTLKSGLQSPIYIDLRRLVGFPELLGRVAGAYLPLLQKLQFDRLAALPYAALPIGTAISLAGGWPLVYARKETKDYGTRALVEGVFQAGDRVVVIDDLATTGSSKFEAIEKLAAAGMQVRDVVVLIDRQSGAAQALSARGFQMHAVLTLTQLLDHWEAHGQVPAELVAAARVFLRETAVG